MERPIWAPWRMEYIAGEKPPGCIFCQFPAAPESDDRANLVVHRSAHSFTCLNRYPYNSGHVMVIPRAHVSDLAALSRVKRDWPRRKKGPMQSLTGLGRSWRRNRTTKRPG